MGLGTAFEAFVKEWPAISSAPFNFIFAIVIVGILIGWAVKAIYKHQIDNAKATTNNQSTTIKLHEATISGLKTEIGNLQIEIDKKSSVVQPAGVSPITHGNTAIQSLFSDIVAKGSVKVSTHPTDSTKWKHVIWEYTPEEFERMAAARRLVETKLANVNEPSPGTYTLTSTSTGDEVAGILAQYIKK